MRHSNSSSRHRGDTSLALGSAVAAFDAVRRAVRRVERADPVLADGLASRAASALGDLLADPDVQAHVQPTKHRRGGPYARAREESASGPAHVQHMCGSDEAWW